MSRTPMADTNADEQWWKSTGIARFELDYDDGDDDEGTGGNFSMSGDAIDPFAELDDETDDG